MLGALLLAAIAGFELDAPDENCNMLDAGRHFSLDHPLTPGFPPIKVAITFHSPRLCGMTRLNEGCSPHADHVVFRVRDIPPWAHVSLDDSRVRLQMDATGSQRAYGALSVEASLSTAPSAYRGAWTLVATCGAGETVRSVPLAVFRPQSITARVLDTITTPQNLTWKVELQAAGRGPHPVHVHMEPRPRFISEPLFWGYPFRWEHPYNFTLANPHWPSTPHADRAWFNVSVSPRIPEGEDGRLDFYLAFDPLGAETAWVHMLRLPSPVVFQGEPAPGVDVWAPLLATLCWARWAGARHGARDKLP